MCHHAPLQSVSTALAGTVWQAMRKGTQAAALFGQSRLRSIQQGTAGGVGVLEKAERSDGGTQGCRQAAGQTGLVVFWAIKDFFSRTVLNLINSINLLWNCINIGSVRVLFNLPK